MRQKISQAVILAAGFGTRLKPFTDTIPKVMVPIGGKPLLQHHIEQFKRYAIRDFFINLHYLPDVVKDHFGNGSKFGVRITYALETKILGTAGGVKQFEPQLDHQFFVAYGDVFSRLDYSKMADAFRALKNNAAGMQLVGPTDHPHDSDLVLLAPDRKFSRILCKPHDVVPKNPTAMHGFYIFNKEILQEVPENTYFEIDHQLLPQLLVQGKVWYGYESSDYTMDIGTPERYAAVQEMLH